MSERDKRREAVNEPTAKLLKKQRKTLEDWVNEELEKMKEEKSHESA